MNCIENLKQHFIKLFYSFDSNRYWRKRYDLGGNSGSGSYGKLAEFKAQTLNKFVKDNDIRSVIELGCGDGNQLLLAEYPKYTGLDISKSAIDICNKKFQTDSTKAFYKLPQPINEAADLAISLDVIFHLTEDSVFESYIKDLFKLSKKYVIIYSSNTNAQSSAQAHHVRHRLFTDWISENLESEWLLIKVVPNQHPYNGNESESSFSDFFIYKKAELT